jgi:hypothetical protein
MNEKRTVKCLRQVEHIKKGIFFAEHIKQLTGQIYLYSIIWQQITNKNNLRPLYARSVI